MFRRPYCVFRRMKGPPVRLGMKARNNGSVGYAWPFKKLPHVSQKQANVGHHAEGICSRKGREFMRNNGWSRREFLTTVPVMVAGVAAMAHGESVANGQAVKWSSGTELPRLKVPPNATDCHHHIYDSRFPPDPAIKLRPGDALISDYRMLQKRIGTTR